MRISLRLIRWTLNTLWKTLPLAALLLGRFPAASAQSFDRASVLIEAITQTVARAGCFADPRQAARDGLEATASGRAQTISDLVASSAPPPAYRRRDVRFDAALGEAWALVEECGHPEKPLRALPLHVSRAGLLAMHLPAALAGIPPDRPGTSFRGANYPGAKLVGLMEPPIVQAGETVRLWQRNGVVRMELAAKSEQAGRLGDEIWLRSDAGGFTQRMRGVVRAQGSVEMLP